MALHHIQPPRASNACCALQSQIPGPSIQTPCASSERTRKWAFIQNSFTNKWEANLPREYLNANLARGLRFLGIDPYLYSDLITYLPECLMTKMDIASMANSLETRSPFLDHEFLELAASSPSSWKLHHLHQSKYILTKAVQGWLPDEILTRGKQGFAIAMSQWFKGQLKQYVEDMLLSNTALSRGLFRIDGLQRMLREHAGGQTDYSYHLWALLMLEHWFETYIDDRIPSENA